MIKLRKTGDPYHFFRELSDKPDLLQRMVDYIMGGTKLPPASTSYTIAKQLLGDGMLLNSFAIADDPDNVVIPYAWSRLRRVYEDRTLIGLRSETMNATVSLFHRTIEGPPHILDADQVRPLHWRLTTFSLWRTADCISYFQSCSKDAGYWNDNDRLLLPIADVVQIILEWKNRARWQVRGKWYIATDESNGIVAVHLHDDDLQPLVIAPIDSFRTEPRTGLYYFIYEPSSIELSR